MQYNYLLINYRNRVIQNVFTASRNTLNKTICNNPSALVADCIDGNVNPHKSMKTFIKYIHSTPDKVRKNKNIDFPHWVMDYKEFVELYRYNCYEQRFMRKKQIQVDSLDATKKINVTGQIHKVILLLNTTFNSIMRKHNTSFPLRSVHYRYRRNNTLIYANTHCNEDLIIPDLRNKLFMRPDFKTSKLFKTASGLKLLDYEKTENITYSNLIKVFKSSIDILFIDKRGTSLNYIDIAKYMSEQKPKDLINKMIESNRKNANMFIFQDNLYIYDSAEFDKLRESILYYVLDEDMNKVMKILKKAKSIPKTIDSGLMNELKSSKFIGTPLEHQEVAISWLTKLYKSELPGAILGDDMGLGKALFEDTLVKVPNGWEMIKNLKINDTVIGRDGKHTKVTGVFPQGVRESYKITFDDGRTAIADKDHLWQVHSYKFPKVNDLDDKINKPQILNTAEMLNHMELNPTICGTNNNACNKMYIPLCSHEDTKDVELPIDPYLLGALLGDGGFTGDSVTFTNNDSEMVDKVSTLLETYDCVLSEANNTGIDYNIVNKYNKINKNSKIKNKMKVLLEELNIYNVHGCNKHIPEIYLNSSRSQKIELIRGLLDSDGYAGVNNNLDFSSCSISLAKDMQQLIWSIGGISKIKESMGSYSTLDQNGVKYIKKTRPQYSVSIRVKNPKELVSLERKKERLQKSTQYSKGLMLGIKSIEKVDDCKTVCISVDNDDKLYVIKDYIVTHNTVSTIGFLGLSRAKKIVVISPASVVGVWHKEIKKFMPSIENNVSVFSYERIGSKGLGGEYDVIILDEGQKVKNPATLAAGVLRNSKAKFKLILTGTPIENKIDDLFSLIMIIMPNSKRLLNEIKNKHSRNQVQGITLTRALIDGLYISRKMSKKQLPVKLVKVQNKVTLSEEERRIYDHIIDYFSKELESIDNNSAYYRAAIVGLMRVIQAISYSKQLPTEILPEGVNPSQFSKIKSLQSIISKVENNGEKIVVFARFTATIEYIKSLYGDRALVIKGDVSKSDRDNIVDKFQTDPKYTIIIISLQAGATGLTLTAANNLAFIDLWWNPAIMEQASRRIYRIGQTKDCIVHYITATDTIDDIILKILLNKTELINALDKNVKDTENNSISKDLINDIFG